MHCFTVYEVTFSSNKLFLLGNSAIYKNGHNIFFGVILRAHISILIIATGDEPPPPHPTLVTHLVYDAIGMCVRDSACYIVLCSIGWGGTL